VLKGNMSLDEITQEGHVTTNYFKGKNGE